MLCSLQRRQDHVHAVEGHRGHPQATIPADLRSGLGVVEEQELATVTLDDGVWMSTIFREINSGLGRDLVAARQTRESRVFG